MEWSSSWNNCKLEDIADIVGGGTPRTEVDSYWDGDIKWYTPSEIGKSKYILDSERHITEDGLNNSSAKLLPKYTILLSSRATVGEISIALTECSTNQGFQSLITKKNTDNDFIYYLISTMKNEFLRRSSGSTFLEISKNEIKRIKINIPTLDEQKKIAKFFSSIDNKIELLEKKHQYYQDFKKYLMQQILAQKLRFDFSDEWKIVKLESLIKKGKAGGTPSSTNSEYYNGDIPFLSIRDMTEQGKYIVKTEKSITEEGLNNSSAWIIPKNSLLYSIYASIGLVAINRSDISTSQAIYGIILKDGVSLEYMYYYLTYFKKNVHKYIETGTQGNLNAKLLKSFEILLPSLEEQEMNVNILSLVDEKIENSKKEIEKINEFKKGLLQQMFIMANFI